MSIIIKRISSGILCFIWVLAVISATQPANAASQTKGGFVYIATNQPSGNSIIQYAVEPDGSLTPTSEVATGGLGGTGNGVGNLDPLGSENSLLLSNTGSLILVVDAGSNDQRALTEAFVRRQPSLQPRPRRRAP